MIIAPKDLRITKPSFIVFEGGNGVGKSTLLSLVASHLRAAGKYVTITREPGGTALGKEIRSLVKERKDVSIDELAELFLFCADRTQHIKECIEPQLAAGHYVFSDRHWFSTVAFQGYGRGLSLDVIHAAIQLSIGSLLPALTVVVDLPIAVARQRMNQRLKQSEVPEVDKFEDEAEQFQERVRQGFLTLARESHAPSVILDGTCSSEQMLHQLLEYITV